MNAGMRAAVKQMVTTFEGLVKGWAQRAETLENGADLKAMEEVLREEGLTLLGQTFERLLQVSLDHAPQARRCPHCGHRRRHKGRRARGLLSSVGAIRLTGPYWYCRDCGGQHALDAWADGSASRMMQEMLCLLGTSLASFAKAEASCRKLLGVRVSANYIRRLCQDEGRRVGASPPEVSAEPRPDVVGSCDGMMVHTRQAGWKEVKAYQFRYGDQTFGRAHLESSDRFLPRIRQAARAMRMGRASRLFWVSDAAAWIDKGISVHLPNAIRIVDIWHAEQHVHEASREIFGEGTPRARQWARRYCRELGHHGGWVVWHSLRRVRYKQASRQAALDALLVFLERNADRMDYPSYVRGGWPISSGPMESFCKQLGQRLKGPGMRWSLGNVDPMAALVSLWSTGAWEQHWQEAA